MLTGSTPLHFPNQLSPMNETKKPHAPHSTDASLTPKRSIWKWTLGLGALLGMGAWYFFSPPKAPVDSPGGVGRGPGGGGPGGGGGYSGGGMHGGGYSGSRGGRGVTPVSTALAAKGELKVYLSALGTVNALNTAAVKTNVAGELLKIYFTEGQLVKAGDILAEIDSRQYRIYLAQTEGQLARDVAQLSNVRRDLERYQSAKTSVTQQQIDTAMANVAQYEGTVQADQASVDNFKLQLSYCRVPAPISGRAGLRMVDQGNMVRPTDAGLVVITQEQPISVVFSIPEDDLPQIRRALAAGTTLEVEAYDRGMKTRLATGRLIAVDNQIDATTGTVRLKASFANEDFALFPNQFVNIRMLTETQEGVTMIPNSAIQLNGPARFVFVVKPDETVERRAITVGRTEGEKTVVNDGLVAGETVVTEGVDRLQSGSKVMARTPIPEAPAATGRGMGGMGGRGGKDGKSGKFGPGGPGGPGGRWEKTDKGAPAVDGPKT